MQINNTAKEIIRLVGGKDNVKELFHCVTRLRFYMKDNKKVNLNEIKKIDGVLGAQYSTDQLQIIIGDRVEDVYNEIIKIIGFVHSEETLKQKKRFQVSGLFETLAAIFLPVVPALAGTGMLKGIIIILTSYCGVSSKAETIQVLNIASDCVFYFLPFLMAWSAAKRFDTNIPIALALAGILLYPTMTAGLAAKASPIHFLGLPIPFPKYASSSIPIILSVWVLSYVYPLVDRIIPKVLRLVFTPMFVILVMLPLELVAIAPAANYLGQGLAYIVTTLFKVSPILAGAVVGSTRPLVVLTGMHLSLGAICLQNLATYGYDTLLPINTMGTLAMAGAAFGTWFKSRKEETKSVSMSAGISAIIGITEPTIYGVLLKFRNTLIATMIGGGIAGAFVAFFKGTASAYANSCILSLPLFFGPALIYVCIGMAMAFVIAFVLVNVLGLSEEKKQPSTDNADKTEVKMSVNEKQLVIYSPINGEITSLKNIEDKTFSDEVLGKGIAIKPTEGKVYAPFDGKVVSVFPTKHAISCISKDGIECLIHLGIDTVKLNGKYFNVLVGQDQEIKKGQLLADFDIKKIEEAGYSTVTPIIVTNSANYFDVLPNELSGIIVKTEPLMTILK